MEKKQKNKKEGRKERWRTVINIFEGGVKVFIVGGGISGARTFGFGRKVLVVIVGISLGLASASHLAHGRWVIRVCG